VEGRKERREIRVENGSQERGAIFAEGKRQRPSHQYLSSLSKLTTPARDHDYTLSTRIERPALLSPLQVPRFKNSLSTLRDEVQRDSLGSVHLGDHCKSTL